MDYKEKYEKALEWMKSIYPTMQGSDKEDAEHYFPELALSEDEKIRLFICDLITRIFWGITWDFSKKDCLAYLEKQKEQKPAENGGKELLYVSNKSYNIGYRDGKREAEQKTAEWSEEDENTIQEIIGCIEQARADSHLSEDHCLRLETFLYNHYRPSWKPSQEQMKAFKSYIEDSQSKAEAAVGGWDKFDVMIHLYEQLKKL